MGSLNAVARHWTGHLHTRHRCTAGLGGDLSAHAAISRFGYLLAGLLTPSNPAGGPDSCTRFWDSI